MGNQRVVRYFDAEHFWKFVPNDMKLAFDDDRRIRVGETFELRTKEERMFGPEPCARGFHACRRLKDTLFFRFLNDRMRDKLCVVKLFGIVEDHTDRCTEKTVASHMEVVDVFDVSSVKTRPVLISRASDPVEKGERLRACHEMTEIVLSKRGLIGRDLKSTNFLELPEDIVKYIR